MSVVFAWKMVTLNNATFYWFLSEVS